MSVYKCLECGHICEDVEVGTHLEKHTEIDGGPNESFYVCPMCGEAVEEASTCLFCGGAFLEEELTADGYCMECLKEKLTVQNILDFFDYLNNASKTVDPLKDFVFKKIIGLKEAPEKSNHTLKNFCVMILTSLFQSHVMNSISDYMYEENLWDDFSEFLKKKGM